MIILVFENAPDQPEHYEKLKEREVKFVRPPQNFEYGTVAVFEDLYGNLWDLLQPDENNKGLK